MDRPSTLEQPPPPADPPNGADLLQSQSECWLRGEPLPVEIYLQLYPALQADRELVLDLVCHEILLRQRRGERPQPEEYYRRFPDAAEDLRTQFDVQRALSAGVQGLATISGLQGGGGPTPLRVAGYEVLRELGRGGMGVVLLARHLELKRLVALKMIQSLVHCCPRQLARFRGEAEVLARLQHPNVVQIYEVGEHEGRPFFALEYLPGGGLDRRLNGTPQPPRQAAQLLRVLARTVSAAHQAGVIHRDLKPANVLLTADDIPKISDFGLAKQIDAATGQTMTGDVLGTPLYMAPEQAYGRRDAIGPWTDVYALGVMLYELLTGRPPFSGATALDTLEQVVSRDPVPPSRLQVKVPRDLEVICLKCLAKEPARRYGSAADLAEDLRRFLAGEPIRARPAPVWERAWKWLRRRPALTSTAAAGLLCAAVLLGGAFVWLKAAAGEARLEAHEARDREAAALTLIDLRDGLHRTETACDARRWDEARSQLDGVVRQLDVAEQTFGATAAFAELRARADGLRQPIERRQTERERLKRFRTLRTEAGFLVLGIAGTDLGTRRERADEIVGQALALFGAGSEGVPLPVAGGDGLSTGEQREVAEGCCEMLLGLAQAGGRLPRTRRAARRTAADALALADRATRLGVLPGLCYGRRARYLRRLGREAEARAEEERARACPPGRAAEFFLRGVDQYTDGDLDAAITAFEKALGLEPDHAAAAYALALPHLRLHARLQNTQPAAARAHLVVARIGLTVCINREPALPWPYLCRGLALAELGEHADAAADYASAERVLHDRPDEAARYALLVSRGALRLRRQELAEAVADLTEAVQLKPQDYQAYMNLARAFQLQGRDADAVRQLDQALAQGPASSLAALHRTRARLHQEAGRVADAVRDLDAAACLEAGGKDSPQAAEDLLAKGRLLVRAGDPTGAIAAFDAALAGSPDHRGALRERAEVLLRLHHDTDALRDLNRLLAGPRASKAEAAALYRSRAAVRTRVGDHAGALEDFTELLDLESDAAAYVGRGWCYLTADAVKLANADFDRALRLNPKDADARNGRANARVRLGNYQDAVDDAEQALELGPATASLRYNAARVFAQAAQKAAEDGTPAGGRRDLSAKYQERALGLLREALAALPVGDRAGFWSGTVQRDAALNAVRSGKVFKELAAEFVTAANPLAVEP